MIAANMGTTGTFAMARALLPFNALVALHKHYTIEKLVAFLEGNEATNTFYSLGTTDADLEKLSAVKQQVELTKICLDVANGYTEKFLDAVKRIKGWEPDGGCSAEHGVFRLRPATLMRCTQPKYSAMQGPCASHLSRDVVLPFVR